MEVPSDNFPLLCRSWEYQGLVEDISQDKDIYFILAVRSVVPENSDHMPWYWSGRFTGVDRKFASQHRRWGTTLPCQAQENSCEFQNLQKAHASRFWPLQMYIASATFGIICFLVFAGNIS